MRTKNLSTILGFPLAAITLAGCATAENHRAVNTSWVLDHVAVVDVRTGRIDAGRAIIIEDGRIAKIVKAGSVTSSSVAGVVDGGGGYVVPGFNDMHAHNLNNSSPETSLPLMLASGVTGFRQMAGTPSLVAQHAARTLTLPADSPALLALSGPVLAGPAVATPASAKAEVDRQKNASVDFIKIVDAPPAAFLAAADEAEALGLPLSGHLPPSIDPRDAVRHGMDSIEHMGPTISLLLSCSTAEASIRAMMAATPPPATEIDFTMAPERLARLLANPVLLTPPPAYQLFEHVLATFDEAKCRGLAKDLAASNTWVVPTLTRLEAMQLGNTLSLRDNPALNRVPPSMLSMWRDVGKDFDSKLSVRERDILSDLFNRQLEMTRIFDAEGVKMLLGTDFGGQWIVAGQSLHHEIDLLALAGVPPLHILQMTTIDAARYLKRDADMGTVEVGKMADLVLLAADPTQNSKNLHDIRAVVRAGRFLDRARLDALTNGAEAKLKQ